jgi:hypothetical protein
VTFFKKIRFNKFATLQNFLRIEQPIVALPEVQKLGLQIIL